MQLAFVPLEACVLRAPHAQSHAERETGADGERTGTRAQRSRQKQYSNDAEDRHAHHHAARAQLLAAETAPKASVDDEKDERGRHHRAPQMLKSGRHIPRFLTVSEGASLTWVRHALCASDGCSPPLVA